MRTHKNTLATKLAQGFLAVTTAIAPYVARGDVLVEPIDSVQTTSVAKWERGQTYSVNVWTTNNGPESVYSGQWKLNIPIAMQPYLSNTSWIRPASSIDFFAGLPLVFQFYGSVGQQCAATLDGSGSVTMPPGTQGSCETYDIAVGPGATLGTFDFTLTSLQFRDNTNTLIPKTITNNQQFRIVPAKWDVNASGVKDANQAYTFTQALLGNPTLQQGELWAGEYCDQNDDGKIDGRDIQPFVNALLAP